MSQRRIRRKRWLSSREGYIDESTRIAYVVLVLALAAGIRPEEIASADCVAVIPGFYKGAAVVGVVFEADLLLEVSFGRGFIACATVTTGQRLPVSRWKPAVWA